MFELTFREQRQNIRKCLRLMPVPTNAPGGVLMCCQPSFIHKSTEQGKDSLLCAVLGTADAEYRATCLCLNT